MTFSFSTIYMTIFTTNLMIIILALCFRNSNIMVAIGYKLFSFFILFTLLRVVFPFEMPFTQTRQLPEWISRFISPMQHPWLTLGKMKFSIWHLLSFIWILGIIISLILYIRMNFKTHYLILSNGFAVTDQEPYCSILRDICLQKKRKNKFVVLRMDDLNTPKAYGLWTHYILVPSNLSLSQDEWYYALGHEVAHHIHFDLYTKAFMDLITIIYWWNPFCRKLSKQLNTVLEMRVDHSIVADKSKSVEGYLNCLLHVAEQAAEPRTTLSTQPMSLLSQQDGILTKRFLVLLSAGKKRNHMFNLLLAGVFLTLYMLSYRYIYEGRFVTEADAVETFDTTSGNSYAILLEDGTYDIYVYDILIENVDTLEFYPNDLPIYSNHP